jgi:hypothetical protein
MAILSSHILQLNSRSPNKVNTPYKYTGRGIQFSSVWHRYTHYIRITCQRVSARQCCIGDGSFHQWESTIFEGAAD